MRRTYGGIEIELPDPVWIFDFYVERPIFHRGVLVKAPNGEGAFSKTRCGEFRFDRPGGYANAAGIPPRHAAKIGRPCLACWPELRGRTLSLLGDVV